MRLSSIRWVLGALPYVLAGCSGPEGQASTSDTPTTLGTLSGTAPGSDGSTGDTSASTTASNTSQTPNETDAPTSAGSGEDPKFDLGVQPDVNQDVEDGCTKVDFLFVVDNSGSMEDDQANLIANFPNFITGIQSTLENVEEYHVGVVTTDAYAGNIPACQVLGGLVTRTGGTASSNDLCGPYADGRNYMTEQDDLASSFACAAQVGVSGNGIERPMNALEATVRGDHAGAGQCNDGFLRDDALLVLVIISDEWDGPNDPEMDGSSGDATSWYNTVVAAKQGLAENIVVLTLSYINGGICPPQDVFFNPADIQTFTEMFGENGFQCCITGDFGQIFMEATGVIAEACDNFVPPG
jgi:hypothetical protein